jgi:type III secretion protein J
MGRGVANPLPSALDIVRTTHRTIQKLMRARLLHVMATALIVLQVAGCAKHVELMAAIPEMEANEVLAALTEAGIQAEKVPGKEGMVSVNVDSAHLGLAVDTLRARGLPRERHATMGQVFKKEGLISSPLEERVRYHWALSQELSATIAQIDGVIAARVHVVLPERGAGGEAPVPSSAAVFVKYQREYNMEQVTPQIKRLITNSIPGLATEKVTAVLVPAEPQGSRAQAAPPIAPQVQLTRNPWFWAVVALATALLALAGFMAWHFRHLVFKSRGQESGAPA